MLQVTEEKKPLTAAERIKLAMEEIARLKQLPPDSVPQRGRKPGVISQVKERASTLYSEVFEFTAQIGNIRNILEKSQEYHKLMVERDNVYQAFVSFWTEKRAEVENIFRPLITTPEENLAAEIERYEKEVIPNNADVQKLREFRQEIARITSRIEELQKLKKS